MQNNIKHNFTLLFYFLNKTIINTIIYNGGNVAHIIANKGNIHQSSFGLLLIYLPLKNHSYNYYNATDKNILE